MKLLLATLVQVAASSSAAFPQEVDTILSKGDELMEAAKQAYEKAKSEGSVEGFIAAGFKLEEARIKYLVVQEIGQGDKRKAAADRLRAAQQLAKLINDGKVAVMKARPAPETPGASPDPAPVAPFAPAPASPRAGADLVKKLPVPDAAAVKETERLIRELFKDDYARKGAADSRALARKLLEQASRTSDDPPGLYALYQAAVDAAAQGCDSETAVYAVDQMARFFDVDRLALRTDALATAAKTARTSEEWKDLAEAQLKLADDLVLDDSFDAADKAATAALQQARKSKNVPLVAKVTAREKEIGEAKTRFRAMKGSLETLAKTPDDPGANLEMGEFLCYVKGNWDLGLRFLSKGSNATLKALAEREIAAPTQAREIFDLAEEWEKLAEKERSSLRKGQMEAHIQELYSASLRGATGLLRVQIEKKLSKVAPASVEGPTKAEPAGALVDLLPLVNVNKPIRGNWTFSNRVLVSPRDEYAQVPIDYSPPEEFILTAVVEKSAGPNAIYFGFVAGGKPMAVYFDAMAGGDVAQLDGVDGKIGNNIGPAHYRGKIFPDSQSREIAISVRQNEFSATVDGKEVIRWSPANYEGVALNPRWATANPRGMFVASQLTSYRITRLTLTPLRGRGRPLR